jgi:F-type H+-transporting ATPase subunit alpha
MKEISGTLKIDLAQFRELEAFATFVSELDKVSQAQLDRGYRLIELLKQPLHEPMPFEEQVIVIYAGTKGFVDDIPVSEVRRFESEFRDFMRTKFSSLMKDIKESKKLNDEKALISAIDDFKSSFDSTSSR